MVAVNKDKEKWLIAQKHEKEYWDDRQKNPVGFIADLSHNFPLAGLIQRTILTQDFERILEVGVGGLGIGLLWLFPKCQQKIGMDPIIVKSPNTGNPFVDRLVLSAQINNMYVNGVGELVPFRNSKYDLVICNNVLDHVINPVNILLEIKRVLQNGGFLALGVDTHSILHGWLKKLSRRIFVQNQSYLLHPHDFLFGFLSNTLEQLGFTIVDSVSPTWKGKIAGRSRLSCWICRI